MASEQTVVLTVVPRGLNIDPKTMPVSVVVSPRLLGDDHLGAFPDWLKWTRRLKEKGLTLTFRCAGKTLNAKIDTKALRPELWEELFNEHTLVRSHQFNDYTQRGIISFSMRQTLSALKTIYQEASVSLALPDGGRGQTGRHDGNRALLRDLLDGFDVHWNSDRAKSWRAAVRRLNSSTDFAQSHQALTGPLDSEGLIIAERNPEAFQQVAVPFAVFHHMPTPPREDSELPLDSQLDKKKLLDFHQVLSSLNAYPELQRALGLIFDLELPPGFVQQTASGAFGKLSVSKTNFKWSVPTRTPELTTAYVHFAVGAQRLFFTAPRALGDPTSPTTIIGLLNLDPESFGIAQVDVDGGMHKTMILAEALNNPDPDRNLNPNVQPEAAPHPDLFDPEATLPSLRSGGFSLFADRRGLQLLDTLKQAKSFNDALTSTGKQPRPFFAEDLVRGFRLDVWDARTKKWHSLHQRSGDYQIGNQSFTTKEEEGFIQLAVMQPAEGATPADKDLYLHEAIARWVGWSLSVARPGKHFSRFADPGKAVPPDGDHPDFLEDQPDTPFKLTSKYHVIAGSLPSLRFGMRYRLRARAVDLAGNSLQLGNVLTDALSTIFALPRDPEGFVYLRYEPVIAPQVVLRDTHAVTDPGSSVDRLVIRTFNDDISKDTQAADTSAADRHIVPSRTSVDMGERLGMFDDASGKLKSDAASRQLIAERDAGELHQSEPIEIAGQEKAFPLETSDRLDTLPYLPDPLARGAAFRDLPGAFNAAVGKVTPDSGVAAPVNYQVLNDPNPRSGSATLISFGDSGDWQKTVGFRLTLAEPQPDQRDLSPHWDPTNRVLTLFLPKGETRVIPLSSYLSTDDLKLMGVWQWLREYIERIAVTNPQQQFLRPGFAVDKIAHVLQRAVEGGHWMLTPPRLLTLVHAVQQPLGKPLFTALNADHESKFEYSPPLQSAPIAGRTDPTELAPITAWRLPGATDAFLIGALRVHGASTAKVDLLAEWDDPVDDPSQPKPGRASHAAHVDELPLSSLSEGYLRATGADYRLNGYYDPEHDQIGFVREGDFTGRLNAEEIVFANAAPRHLFNDTKHHRVTYSAQATSRYREYFPQDQNLDFTRTSEAVTVDVPASARPLAASVAYVLPTFDWQRQSDTNMKRSVRFGGGLRIYLQRPWFSSGADELLGVALWSSENGALNSVSRDKFKPFITQWGMDPIWQTGTLSGVPGVSNFPDFDASDVAASLEERTAANAKGETGRVDVVGFAVSFDETRQLWFADLTLNTFSETYMPFVRLALVRYQPHALADAKISRVVLADFVQLTPDRSALITSDPHHPRTLRVVVSGIAPRGPQAIVRGKPRPATLSLRPTQIRVRVQHSQPGISSDLTWQEVAPTVAIVHTTFDNHLSAQPDMEMWSGTVTFSHAPRPGQFRLLIEEWEFISANYTLVDGGKAEQPRRLIYAETVELDDALVSES